jgi:hypothetical protein
VGVDHAVVLPGELVVALAGSAQLAARGVQPGRHRLGLTLHGTGQIQLGARPSQLGAELAALGALLLQSRLDRGAPVAFGLQR